MNEIDETAQKKVNEIVSVIKLASLLFCTIIIYNQYSIKDTISTVLPYSYFSVYPMGILSLSIVLIFLLWSFPSTKIFKFKNIKFVHLIENLAFIIVFSILIIFSKNYVSQYNFLFIFIIIASTLQSGIKQGMFMAFLSSLIILLIDLIYLPSIGVNVYFENNLIMTGVFVLTAWPLGHYVQIEEENVRQKNLQLKTLNDELATQNNHRKYIEELLLKNDICYNLLIENSKGAIFVHRDNKLIFANESALNLVGLTNKDKLINQFFLDFIPEKEKNNVTTIFKKIYFEKKAMINFESSVINKENSIIEVQNISCHFIYEGKPAIISILYDVSSEKQVKQLKIDVEKNVELLNETKEFNNSIIELFSNISHELKTPLTVIFSAVQLLSVFKVTDDDFLIKKDKYLLVMKQNCYRLMRLINNFLDITKLDSGFVKVNLGNYDIVKIVEDITLSVSSYIESNNISLIFDTNVEEKIMAFDPDKIERIMLNLLSNAFKYSHPNGKILVTLLDKKDKIYISVKDTGTGIPEDKKQLIFERFGQADKTLKRVCEGTGIGLSLVKSFVEMHNGTIELKSKIDVGSDFIIMLPAETVKYAPQDNRSITETNIERISIEFSDIYSDVS